MRGVTPARGLVLIDGVQVPRERAVVSVYDRGFLYGDSVFEVIRTYGGNPFGLEEHVARLHRSASKIAMDLPWSEEALTAEILGAVREAGFAESYVRVIVTRGVGQLGLDPDLAGEPTRVVMVHPLTLPPVAAYRDGVGVLVVESMRATDGTTAEGAKSSNYLANLLALREAKLHGAYEPLFVDRRADVALDDAEVLEGGTSNVFAIFLTGEAGEPGEGAEGGRRLLVTPPERRILGGITRRHVLAAAPGAGFEVRIEPITLRRFRGADELFLTSTVRELVPVVRLIGTDTHVVGSGRPGEATRELHKAFRALVGASGLPLPWERPG
ncbi:MAG: aminotransferase class IV [Deltaproteobacteria bacterium]|nr:aminotransferase class IV [Deltaproteobacteria bacterium]